MPSWDQVFTKKNIEVLNILREGALHIREIAARLKLSPAKVHQSISLFSTLGLVSIVEKKNRKYAQLDMTHPQWLHISAILYGNKTAPITYQPFVSRYDLFSPLDFRYGDLISQQFSPYLSEAGFVSYLAKMEAAVAQGLCEFGLCPKKAAEAIVRATKKVTASEVYAEEARIKHNVRALVNCITRQVPQDAKPYVHFSATSHDIICSADAARLKDCTLETLLPLLSTFLGILSKIALREKMTVQIGRTHGQHAEPITFGYALALYVDRLGNRLIAIEETAKNLRGKFAGAVGAYNGQSLIVKDPLALERYVLREMGIKPSPISTQVVEPEFMTDYCHALISTFGVLANLADDMRHLQRTEINEIAEAFSKEQVGSSTMPHKRNPINFENVKSLWKVAMPRMITLYMDQICEHQRDLTNSASSRFVPELIILLASSAQRLTKVMEHLVVDTDSMQRNFNYSKELIVAEPAYLLLAKYKHPDAHETVRKLSQKARDEHVSFTELFFADATLKSYVSKFSEYEITVLKNPAHYIGLATKRTEDICSHWETFISKKSWR